MFSVSGAGRSGWRNKTTGGFTRTIPNSRSRISLATLFGAAARHFTEVTRPVPTRGVRMYSFPIGVTMVFMGGLRGGSDPEGYLSHIEAFKRRLSKVLEESDTKEFVGRVKMEDLDPMPMRESLGVKPGSGECNT